MDGRVKPAHDKVDNAIAHQILRMRGPRAGEGGSLFRRRLGREVLRCKIVLRLPARMQRLELGHQLFVHHHVLVGEAAGLVDDVTLAHQFADLGKLLAHLVGHGHAPALAAAFLGVVANASLGALASLVRADRP